MVNTPVQEAPYFGEALEVEPDELAGLLLIDAQLAAQRKGTLSIDGREVDRLCAGPHLRRDLLDRNVEDDRRGLPVDVAAPLKGADEHRVL